MNRFRLSLRHCEHLQRHRSQIVRPLLYAFLLLPGLQSLLPATEPDRPNMLVILADDLGYGDLACRGAKDMRTPNLDRLFDQGMEFTNFYANCPVCSPTRAALLSGRYQEQVGVPGVIRTHPANSWGYLSPKVTLLP
ncbi:MAG: sulfatase-like hydrolase/transferase, partial [Fuerstiella sp.]|nr:sulfatase-like hydrolase/transferase [Fuerstiella sp.]